MAVRIAGFKVVDPESERILLLGFKLAGDADVGFYRRQLVKLGFRKVAFISWFDDLFPYADLDIVDWAPGKGDPVLVLGPFVAT